MALPSRPQASNSSGGTKRSTGSCASVGRRYCPSVMEFDTSSGGGSANRAMSVVVLDDSATVTLPTDFAPLPGGSLTYKVSAFDAGAAFDPRDFAIDDLQDQLIRLSTETIKLN